MRLLLAVALAVTAGCAADAPKPTPAAESVQKPAATAPADPAMAMVNGVPVPQSHLEFLFRQHIAQGAPNNAQTRTLVRQELINRELLAQEAQRTGIMADADVTTHLEVARKEVLASAYLRQRLRRQPISDEEFRQEHQRVSRQVGEREYRARHILVSTEAHAKDIIARLDGGGRFEDLARTLSMDPGSANSGGDLGWSPAQTYVRTFAEALAGLQKGAYTREPVRTEFGYHVIRLDDMRVTRAAAPAEIEQLVQQRLTQKRIDEAVRELRAKAKVE